MKKSGQRRSGEVGRGFLFVLLFFLSSACLATEHRREYEDLLADMRRRPGRLLAPSDLSGALPAERGLPDLEHRLTLDGALRFALSQSPQLLAKRRRWEERIEQVPQSGALDDPQFRLLHNIRPIETRSGPKRNELLLTQKIPFPGKLGLREEAALASAQGAKENYESARERLAYQVKRAYHDLVWVYEAITINERNSGLLKALEEIAQSKYRVGAVTQQDVIRAQVRRTHIKHRFIKLERERKVAQARLNEALGRPARALLARPRESDLGLAVPGLPALERGAIERRPEFKALEHELRGSSALLGLAKKDYLPDFLIGFNYQDIEGGTNAMFRRDGDDAFKLVFGFNLPIYLEKRSAKVRQAQARIQKSRARYLALRRRVEREVHEAYERFREARHEIELYRGTLLGQARQSLAAAQAGYEADKVNFLTLVEAQKTLQDIELDERRALRNAAVARAELEWASGADLTAEKE